MTGSSTRRRLGTTAAFGRLVRRRLFEWLKERNVDEGVTLMVFATLVGIAGGLATVAFYRLIDLSYLLFIRWPEPHLPRYAHAVYLPLLTAAGVWAAWLVVRRARLPDGQNVPDVQLAVAKRDGVIRTYPVVMRTIASAFTLGAGGSAGSEGPVAVLGSLTGSALGRRLRLQARHVKILVGCGAAAGIAAAFNAPFAGAFFALEEVLGSFSVAAFSPVVIASVVGALTVRPFLGSHPIFQLPHLPDTHAIASALLYPVLGIACGLVSAAYARLYVATPRLADRLPGPVWLRPLVGGFATGGIVLLSGGLLSGNGHLAIPQPVFGGLAWYALIALAFAKVVATVVTLGFGGSGGVFTPTLFIGAALGGGLGVIGAQVVPGDVIHPHAWALVGMAGLVAGATRAPLTAIFMVFEMTNDYSYVVPLMIVAVIAFVTAKRYSAHGLYDGWLAARGEHLAHGVDQAIMERLHARAALDARIRSVSPAATVDDVVRAASETRHGAIPVVEDDRTLIGLITHHSLREAITARGDLARLLIAEDLAESVDAVAPDDSLRKALAVMNVRGLDAVAVVDIAGGSRRFIGLLSRADILRVYEQELTRSV
jgi:CIC family chloride channel protein